MEYTITPENGRYVVRNEIGREIASCRYEEGAINVVSDRKRHDTAKAVRVASPKTLVIGDKCRSTIAHRKLGSYVNYLAEADLTGEVSMRSFEFRVLFHLACLCDEQDTVRTSIEEIADSCYVGFSAVRMAISNLWDTAWLRYGTDGDTSMDNYGTIHTIVMLRPVIVRHRVSTEKDG